MPNCEFPHPAEQKCTFLLCLLSRYPISFDELSQLLASRCCDVNQANTSGMTAIKAAIMNGNLDIVRAIHEAGGIVSQDHLDFAKTSYPHKTEIVAYLTAITECDDIATYTHQGSTARCSKRVSI